MNVVRMNNNESGNSGWIDKNLTAYKITISVIFGLLGFSINFLTISFSFPPYIATVLIGLLFPMLITLSWGWKYGLLSALAGGCQSVWWLWGPSNGYAVFSVVPPFTLWIVWHGLFAELRKKRKDHQWWLNTYAIEVPFRILSTINLYTLARWAITLNPPPWSWASGAPDTIPIHFSNFVVIKQCVVGYIILLLADVLLNFGFIRRFFGLKEKTSQADTSYIISASLLLGALFWIIDSILGSSAFHRESSFLDLLALSIPHYALYVRTFFILACLSGGLLASRLLRKQRESDIALKESEKRLSHVVDGIAIPTFMIDRKHTLTHWNRACENLTGVFANQMVGTKKQWSVFYSEERPVLADLILEKLSGEEIAGYYDGKVQKSAFIEGAYNAENFFPGIGKSGKWLFFTAAPLKDRMGEVIGAIEILQDITERKQAEEVLRKSEEKFRTLFEDSRDAIYLNTRKGEFIDVNQAMLDLFGYTREEMIGMNAIKIYTNPEERSNSLREIDQKGFHKDYEIKFKKKDGREMDCLLTSATSRADDGSLLGYQGIIKDITEQKQAVEALRESEGKHRLLADNTVDCIWQMNLDLEFTYINQAILPFLGYTPKEWIGSKLSEHCSSEEMEKMQAIILDILANLSEKTTEVFETSLYHKNGKEIPCEISRKIVLDDAGNPIYFQGNTRNITQRKRADEEKEKLHAQLSQAQKMEAIGTLTGGIAHDFNNLLTTIIGNAQIALMDVIKDESLRRGIEDIKKAGDRSASLIRQLLAFSRKQVIRPDVLDLNNVINETEKMLKRMIAEDIEFQTVLEPELWKVHMDSGQIEQVVMNLVVNAKDAMPKGGKLTVETANVNLDGNYFRKHGIKEEQPGSYVMLAVSDTGFGMDKETQEHIFDPFFTTKEIGKGTGLGLSTVYGIVKQNNGFTWTYSELGQGSTFKIYLPKAKKDAASEKKEKRPATVLGGSETVLIVEDDDSLRKLAKKALQQYGYRVLTAENGEDALRVSKEYEGSIHLMITDVVMPKMSGRETTERLQPLYPQMKVIYMSGYTDNAIVHHGVLEPGLNFLEKPFSPEGLARKVREVLDIEN